MPGYGSHGNATSQDYSGLAQRSGSEVPAPQTLTRRIQGVNEQALRLANLLREIHMRIAAGDQTEKVAGLPPMPPEPEHALFAAEAAARRLDTAEQIANEILRLL